jgi:hypothetical protein
LHHGQDIFEPMTELVSEQNLLALEGFVGVRFLFQRQTKFHQAHDLTRKGLQALDLTGAQTGAWLRIDDA